VGHADVLVDDQAFDLVEDRGMGGVELVADRTSTVPDALASVNANLKPVRDFCESV